MNLASVMLARFHNGGMIMTLISAWKSLSFAFKGLSIIMVLLAISSIILMVEANAVLISSSIPRLHKILLFIFGNIMIIGIFTLIVLVAKEILKELC